MIYYYVYNHKICGITKNLSKIIQSFSSITQQRQRGLRSKILYVYRFDYDNVYNFQFSKEIMKHPA